MVSNMHRKLMLVLTTGFLIATNAWAGKGEDILNAQCKECHTLSGPSPQTLADLHARKGPDLHYAGNKYKAAWMEGWLQKPTRIRPAGMFYGNHIKRGKTSDQIDTSSLVQHVTLSADDASAVTNVLMSLKAKSELVKEGEYQPGDISLSMGEMMFDKFRGCLACHEIEPGYGGLSGPEVYTVADRLQEDYMISYMRNPKAWDPKIFMSGRKLKDSDLQKLVHYFRALTAEKPE